MIPTGANKLKVSKRIAAWFLPVVMAACVSSHAPDNTATSDTATVTLSVVGTNDVHGALIGSDHLGGMELLGGYIGNLRKARTADGGAVLLIDAGDMWQGTLESNLSEGASVVEAYNALQYTAAAFGNHEFDFGPAGPLATPVSADDDPQGNMKARASQARFPMLAANLIDLETGEPVAWDNVYPSVIVEAAGVRVGIIGLMTASAFQVTILANTQGLRVDPLAEVIEQQARSLRADGADVIIVTAHAGSRCTEFDDPYDLSSCNTRGEIFRVANALPPDLVDVIIGGHAHTGIAHFVNGIAVSSSYSSNRAFGRIDLQVDPATGSVVSRHIHPPQPLCRYRSPPGLACAEAENSQSPPPPAEYEGTMVLPDAMLADVITPAIASAETVKMTRLGIRLETPIPRGPIPESPIGNLMTDALLESTAAADFAIHNTRGGIRADLPAGDLIYGSLYEMFPFDNRVVTIELTGAELRSVLADQLEAPNWRAGFSGGRVNATCVGDDLRVTISRPSGTEVDDGDRLTIATADFLVSGGDDIFTNVIPVGGFPIPDDAPLVRDVLESWLKNRGGSISADTFYDENNRRWIYDTPPPITCSEL